MEERREDSEDISEDLSEKIAQPARASSLIGMFLRRFSRLHAEVRSILSCFRKAVTPSESLLWRAFERSTPVAAILAARAASRFSSD
jgi:hypothetical protein